MAISVFVDINIIIDLLDEKRSQHQAAVHLFSEAEAGNIQIFLSESVLNTVSYLVRKSYSLDQLKTIFTNLLSFSEIIEINNFIYSSAISRTVNDFEDAVLYTLALSKQLDYFITNDLKDFKKLEMPALPVIQAKELLKLI